VQVAHACNPSYSGGRDQEDLSSKPAQVNSSRYTISKKPINKKGLVEWLKVQSPVLPKKNNNNTISKSK
jgi:hypothetical protein